MQLNVSIDDLRPAIDAAIAAAITAIREKELQFDDRLAFDEPSAARLIGLERHQLRDERLRGRIGFSRIVGRGVRYTRHDLMGYLNRDRSEARI